MWSRTDFPSVSDSDVSELAFLNDPEIYNTYLEWIADREGRFETLTLAQQNQADIINYLTTQENYSPVAAQQLLSVFYDEYTNVQELNDQGQRLFTDPETFLFYLDYMNSENCTVLLAESLQQPTQSSAAPQPTVQQQTPAPRPAGHPTIPQQQPPSPPTTFPTPGSQQPKPDLDAIWD